MNKICILDYGSGNIQSLKISINFLDINIAQPDTKSVVVDLISVI